MVVRDLSYHVVLFPKLSPFCFSSFSVLASLLLFHRIICNLVFEYIYLGLICSFDEVPLEAGFPNFCDISRQLSIYRVDSRLTELWIFGLWKSCYSVCHMFVADYYMPIYLLIPYTLGLSSTVVFLSL